MDYETIKALAKQLKRPVTSLIALAPQNDPFYCGQPAQLKKAEWFAELWQRFGYEKGVHLRRMHYQIISQDPPVIMVNGKPYENTQGCWGELDLASKAARYLGLVDAEAFVDRRNGEASDNVSYTSSRYAFTCLSSDDHWNEILIPDMPQLPNIESAFGVPQAYHLEIWCEKSTMNDILEPIAAQYKAVLQYGMGELSITIAVEALRRFERSRKPARIFYVSDFDPAGECMPVSMSRKLEFYNLELGLNLDIKLFPLLLTAAQVTQYRLPRTPIKETERRRDRFEERYGKDATELDALEANHPGVLASILRQEIERYYDASLDPALKRLKDRIEKASEQARDGVYARYQAEIDALYETYRGLWLAIRNDLEEVRPHVSNADLPTVKPGRERDNALFDSARDYLTQNAVYQEHKGKDTYEEETA